MIWGLLVLVIGGLYGFFTPGRENKSRLFIKGVIIGVVVAVIFALLGGLSGSAPLGIGSGFVGIIIDAIILSLLFVVVSFIGDWLENNRKSPSPHDTLQVPQPICLEADPRGRDGPRSSTPRR